MTIYNRWGDLLFFSNLIDQGWDGKQLNRDAPPGVYIYSLKIKINSPRGSRTTYKQGDVTLMN